jgi:hypothetical protein
MHHVHHYYRGPRSEVERMRRTPSLLERRDHVEPSSPRGSQIGCHEAAHCVVAKCFNTRINVAVVGHGPPGREREMGGYIETQDAPSWDQAVIDMAGGAADELFGRSYEGSATDKKNVYKNVRCLPGVTVHNAHRAIELAREAAAEIVARHRAVIERLAVELDGRGTMSGPQIREFLSDASLRRAGLEPLLPGPACPQELQRRGQSF